MQQLSGLVRNRPPAGATGSVGLLYHRLYAETAPWLLYGRGKNQQTCPALTPIHLSMRQTNRHAHTHTYGKRQVWSSDQLSHCLLSITYREALSSCKSGGVGAGCCSPFPKLGMQNGMLMTPKRSSIGISDLRMALIRMASPLPAWINWYKKDYISVSIYTAHLWVFVWLPTCISGAQRPSRSMRAA